MKYKKIELPYSYDSLEPYIDAETVNIHYNKHYQGYVDKLNELVSKCSNKFIESRSLNEVLYNIRKVPKNIRENFINFGGGVSNHSLYFSILSPSPKENPKGELLEEINKCFGSFENLKKEISKAALDQFGSGYGWLVKDKSGKLKVMNTLNQDSPYMYKLIPILTIDVWEHAYYLKYKNERKKYIDNIWNVIDWGKIEKLYNNEMC